MKRIMIACVAVAAFAAPAFAGPTNSQGSVNNNTANAAPLAYERSFGPNGNNANAVDGGRVGPFGQIQSQVAPPDASGYGEPAGPYGQVVLQDGTWNGGVSWTGN